MSFRGRPEGRGPESMNTGLWKMDSGLAAARRPGMTVWGTGYENDPLAAVPPVEGALEHLAVARHEEAEAEIDRRGENVGLGGEALPMWGAERVFGGVK